MDIALNRAKYEPRPMTWEQYGIWPFYRITSEVMHMNSAIFHFCIEKIFYFFLSFLPFEIGRCCFYYCKIHRIEYIQQQFTEITLHV